MNFQSVVEEVNEILHQWYPRHVLRRTNWMYRLDSLRPRDTCEMSGFLDLAVLLRNYASHLFLWGTSLRSSMMTQPAGPSRDNVQRVFNIVTQLSQMFLCEGYCYFYAIFG